MGMAPTNQLLQPDPPTQIDDSRRVAADTGFLDSFELTAELAAGGAAFLVAILALVLAFTTLRRFNTLRALLEDEFADKMGDQVIPVSVSSSYDPGDGASDRISFADILRDVKHLKAANDALRDENESLKNRLARLESLLEQRAYADRTPLISPQAASPDPLREPGVPARTSAGPVSNADISGALDRARSVADRAASLFDHSFELQDFAEKNGLVFMKVSEGGLRPIELRASHNDRWMLAAPDQQTGLACLHFGPRVARERIKLRLNNRFLDACAPFFEIDRSAGRLELIEPAVITISDQGCDVVRKGAMTA